MARKRNERNQPIGTCPCPVKGCELETKVFRYRQRSELEYRRRLAGLLYVVCDEHGRMQPQEFILEHATIEAQDEPAPPAPAPKAEPAPADDPPAAPRRPAAPRTPAPRRPASQGGNGWGFF